jgi:GGDEF domain-containing protein
VGDRFLQLLAERLRGLVRPTDAVARLGGDGFAVVLAGVRVAGETR